MTALLTAKIKPEEIMGFTFYTVRCFAYTSEEGSVLELVLDMIPSEGEARQLAEFWKRNRKMVNAIAHHTVHESQWERREEICSHGNKSKPDCVMNACDLSGHCCFPNNCDERGFKTRRRDKSAQQLHDEVEAANDLLSVQTGTGGPT